MDFYVAVEGRDHTMLFYPNMSEMEAGTTYRIALAIADPTKVAGIGIYKFELDQDEDKTIREVEIDVLADGTIVKLEGGLRI